MATLALSTPNARLSISAPSISSPPPPSHPSPAVLSAARAAYVERIDAAMLRAQLSAQVPGSPSRLISAGLYLVDAGVCAPSCPGEEYFGWDPAACRRYLAGLDPAARAAEIEAGRKVLFDSRNAICPDISMTRREADVMVAQMDDRWARNSNAYFAAKDAGKAVANG